MREKWLPTMLMIAMLVSLLSVAPVSAAPGEDVVHIVRRGDTLYSIARRYGVDVWTIARVNNIVNTNLIYVGQRLVIPTGQLPSPDAVHVVRRGENLFRISLRYGVNMWDIVRVNNIVNPSLIYVGQRLTIPSAAPPGPSPTPVPPTPASPGDAFELGGQTLTLDHPDEMELAGMSWIKFQVRWSPGMDGSQVTDFVQRGQDEGFKVLLSISGDEAYPDEVDFAEYVSFLGEAAEQGPDAIEIWNEQNIDREWPRGEIDPAAYVNLMLAPGYRVIKSVDSDILVISGAPAPTGYFGGRCTGDGCDDAPYISGMVAAGATRLLDCIGVHYNEGILLPSRTSGDPRGNSEHYTRYFWGMVNTYHDQFGGQRPLCFTELGYLSPEGYGDLPPNFAWAAGTSEEEQAAWVAEAASLAASSGKIRLMMVYNVDLTAWTETDPQAGYAIIRPDGDCPACETLQDVMSD